MGERVQGLAACQRNDEALDVYAQLEALGPLEARGWTNKGIVLRQLHRYEEALAATEKALALEPENPLIWTHKGSALAHLKRHTEALEAVDHALALDPGYLPAADGRSVELRRLFRLREWWAAVKYAFRLRRERRADGS